MRGGFSDYKFNREGVDLPLSCLFLPSIHQKSPKIKLHLGYKSGFSVTKLDFRLQKLRFVYKYVVVNLQSGIWTYKMASRVTIDLIHLKVAYGGDNVIDK
jgi:hypothetical protein